MTRLFPGTRFCSLTEGRAACGLCAPPLPGSLGCPGKPFSTVSVRPAPSLGARPPFRADLRRRGKPFDPASMGAREHGVHRVSASVRPDVHGCLVGNATRAVRIPFERRFGMRVRNAYAQEGWYFSSGSGRLFDRWSVSREVYIRVKAKALMLSNDTVCRITLPFCRIVAIALIKNQ